MTRPLILLDPEPRTRAMILTDAAWDQLHRRAEVVAHFGSRMPDNQVEALLDRVEIIVGQTAMPAERLARAPRLRAIINVKGNWEPNIDYAGCQARGIAVLSIAPVMAPAVAEMSLGFAIALGRNILVNHRRFRAGEDLYGIRGNQSAYSLYGAAIGFVGYGNLGRALRPLLRPFGCRVRAHDPFLTPGYLADEGCEAASLDDVLARSRFIFILAGVTTQNEGFLDRGQLMKIEPDSSVILVSRAEVADFPTFVELAEAGRFRAAIDVFPVEPVPADDPVRRTRNILLSSHLAGGIFDSYRRISEALMDEIPQLLAGLPPLRLQRAEPRLAAMQRSR
jgi:phosphoglycerate dehydrogenase-like enzyme